MKPATIPALLCASLMLTACAASKPSGAVRVLPPDTALTRPCDRPEAALSAKDWAIIAGRLGVSLIECGREKAALVDYVTGLHGAMK